MTSKVLHRGEPYISELFEIQLGVKQECLLSPFLFLITINWVIKQMIQCHRDSIHWFLMQQLNDLNSPDDFAFLSHSHQLMQRKTERLEKTTAQVATGLMINWENTKFKKINSQSIELMELEAGAIEEVQLIFLPWKQSGPRKRLSGRHQSEDWKGLDCIQVAATGTGVEVKREKDQSVHLQLQINVQSHDLKDESSLSQKNSVICQRLSPQNSLCKMA